MFHSGGSGEATQMGTEKRHPQPPSTTARPARIQLREPRH